MAIKELQVYKIKSQKKNRKDFSNVNLISQPNLFQYLCSLKVDQFNIILDCVLPYIHLIPYPDCVEGTGHRRLEPATELLLVLFSLYLVMDFMKESWTKLLGCQMLLFNSTYTMWLDYFSCNTV